MIERTCKITQRKSLFYFELDNGEKTTMQKKSRRISFVRILSATAIYVGLSFLALIFLIPLIWAILNSFKPLVEINTFPPTWLPNTVRWQNYLDVWNTGNFPRYFVNSGIVALFKVAGTILIASLTAYPLARMNFRGRDLLFLFVLAGMMISPEVLVIPRYLLVAELDWVDTFRGLIVPGLFTPFACFVFRQFFLSIPREIEEAALIDGCGRLRSFWTIILSLTKPAFAVMAIFRFQAVWNELLWPVIVTNTDRMRVLTIGLSFFKSEEIVQLNLLLAGCVMAIIPTVVVFFLFQRYFVRGVGMTGLKY